MRISIDKDTCIGAGQCMMTAPEVFTDDGEGFSALLPGRQDAADDPAVREAVHACPVRAISVTGDPAGIPETTVESL